MATRRWHRIEVYADRLELWAATTEGMVTPVAWQFLEVTTTPADVTIASMSSKVHLAADDSVPATGTGIPGTIDFAPDGTATAAATLFVGTTTDPWRVGIFRMSASAYVFESW